MPYLSSRIQQAILHPKWLLPAVLLLPVVGCGPGQGDLSGKVSFQGKPVCSGSVVVRGSDGVPVGGEIKADSTYVVKNVAAGSVLVTVNSPDPGEARTMLRVGQAPPPPKDRSKWFAIPERYAEFSTSGLSYQLKAGPNSWDIDLK